MSARLASEAAADDSGAETPILGIIGLGYVGLPLAVTAGSAGLRVIGFDVNPAVVEGVNEGRSHIRDVPPAAVGALVNAGVFEATADLARLGECDVVAICVPTPLGKTRDPDLGFVVRAGEAVAACLRPGQLVILESTTYPGTTREVLLPILTRPGQPGASLTVGEDFFLCFSPERVDPGNARWGTRNTPRVVGGITGACTARGAGFYRSFIDTVVAVSSPEAAELTKLLENTFRAVNIGLANEVAQIADRLGVDVWEVIDAAATKPFGFMKFTPGPGLGGHCIPVDPQFLSWKMRSLDMPTRLIDQAAEVNQEMPHFVVRKVQYALNECGRAVKGSRVLVLGVAYKPDVEDVRESPAFEVLEGLETLGAEVRYHDPLVPDLLDEEGRTRIGVPLTDEELESADCVVIVTDHSAVDYEAVLSRSKIVVDARNAIGRRVPGVARERGGWILRGGRFLSE